jgi:hypothetical protein
MNISKVMFDKAEELQAGFNKGKINCNGKDYRIVIIKPISEQKFAVRFEPIIDNTSPFSENWWNIDISSLLAGIVLNNPLAGNPRDIFEFVKYDDNIDEKIDLSDLSLEKDLIPNSSDRKYIDIDRPYAAIESSKEIAEDAGISIEEYNKMSERLKIELLEQYFNNNGMYPEHNVQGNKSKSSVYENWIEGKIGNFGSFHTALLNLYKLADNSNRKKLEIAFPDWFTTL